MGTVRVTAAQALVRFLAAQHVERDGVRQRFFGGCFGIFGHGNVAGLGEALLANAEPAALPPGAKRAGHGACGRRLCANAEPARRVRLHVVDRAGRDEHGHRRRPRDGQPPAPCCSFPATCSARTPRTRCCSSSRARSAGDVSVNDCFRPVSRYFDRIWRPEQVISAALQAMRVLTSPAETGAVTLAFPQDVQAEAFDCPEGFLAERTWHVAARSRPMPRRSRARPR